MAEGGETKTCPFCAETIKAAAKICPFCQTRLNRWGLWGPELAVVFYVVVLIGFWGLLIKFVFEAAGPFEGRQFARHRNELEVARSHLELAPMGQETWISGFVTNRGPYAWRVQQFEVRFQDDQQTPFDVLHPTVKPSFVVLPGREHAFRVRLGKLAWTNEPRTVVVRVHAAIDGSLWQPAD